MSLAQPRQAIQMFEQAVASDPEFALAHAGLANIYSRLPIATDGPSRGAIERARDAAVKALAVDNRLAEAYTALGWISFYHDWDWTQSEKHFTHALTINRRDFSAHLGYAHLLSNTDRLDEALKENPTPLFRWHPLVTDCGDAEGTVPFVRGMPRRVPPECARR